MAELIEEPTEVYHANPGISASGLIKILKSPRHYYEEYILGNRPDPTPAMRFGAIVHSALLEPGVFLNRYTIQPKFDRRSKKGKEEYAHWVSGLSDDAIVMTSEEAERVRAMIASIESHPVAYGLLTKGVPERSIYFDDPLSGERGKFRPDWLREDGRIVDLKTTKDAGFAEFQKSIARYFYHVQTVWYRHGYEIAFGNPPRESIYIAVENTPPYAVAVYVADETILERGAQLIKRAAKTYAECLKTNTWPSYQYSESSKRYEAQTMALPPWALWDYEESV